ncbi:hypothetical protein [Nocardioides sp.]|uniref:HD domain-containing protein n=1 Tax=Nocardioides sp. TaxID=35761 RepID=UPI0035695055
MEPSATEPSQNWPLPAHEDLHERLVAAYSDPRRGYHDIRHLGEVFARLEELARAGTAFEQLPVTLAAWFHDAVYDGERDAEERSAIWAEESLGSVISAEAVAEVARLVRMTETHTPDDSDANGCALSDADLAILAAPPERYEEYVAAVRTEFAHLDDSTFKAGRAAVLQGLSDKPRLFHTDYAREHWEAAARANVTRELGSLRVQGVSPGTR